MTEPRAKGLAWLFGLFILLCGLVMIAAAFATRGEEKQLAS
ncbi:MAG: hypothetical protein QM655_12215 [Nocardioidaceae bacterium]